MVAVGDVYELVVQTEDSSRATQCLNVFHFRQKAGFLSAINLVAEWRTNIETQYRALLSSVYQVNRYAARSMIPYNTDYYELIVTPALVGTQALRGLPPLVAQVVTWRTGLPGRRKRGRSYIPGVEHANQVGGLLSAAYVTGAGAAFGNQIMARFGPTGLSATTEIGVWSRLNGNQDPPHDPAGFTPITAFTFQPRLASMGTRRWGRGM